MATTTDDVAMRTPLGGINLIVPEIPMPRGNPMKGKVKRWRMTEQERKITVLRLANCCQNCGYAQAHGTGSIGGGGSGTDAPVTPEKPSES
jgi:hypothetical protein